MLPFFQKLKKDFNKIKKSFIFLKKLFLNFQGKKKKKKFYPLKTPKKEKVGGLRQIKFKKKKKGGGGAPRAGGLPFRGEFFLNLFFKTFLKD